MRNRKTKVFVDAEVLVAEHFSGIGHYCLELFRALDRAIEDRPEIEITLGGYFRRYKKLYSYGFRNITVRRTPFPLRISNGLKIKGLQPYYDLFFGRKIYVFPNYTSWPLLFSKSVSFIYDLSFEHFPQFVEPNNQKFLSEQVKKTAKRSKKIVTISTNSQREISEFYGISKKSISIIYPGIDQSEFFKWPRDEVAKVKAKYGIHGEYILFVGNLEPRKNLKRLLHAYEKLDPKIRDKYSILLIGASGWLDNEILDTIIRLRVGGSKIQQPIEHVKDKDRPALYSGASLFVYPSVYEGFGIPPLEAMACGVPVVSSNNSSLPEAVGKAAILFDAENIDQLVESINKGLGDSALRKRLVSEGYRQVDKYSWDKEARKLLDVLLEIK